MGYAKVTIKEIDLSTRVPEFPGAYGAMVIGAVRGPLEPTLVSGEADFLEKYTLDGYVPIGADNAYFSALAFLNRSNKLWVSRAVPADYAYGGCTIVYSGSTGTSDSWSAGELDPTAYDWTGDTDSMFALYGADPGAWNDELSVKVYGYTGNEDKVKEPNGFLIEVYSSANANVPIESWICSIVPGTRDGYNNNIFIEDVLEGSVYIRGLLNPNYDDATNGTDPEDETTAIAFSGGSDGTALADTDYETALTLMESADTYPATIVMDGGHATVTYHQDMLEFCEARRDCVAILSTPLSEQITTTYQTDIADYKNTDLNPASPYNTFGGIYAPHVKVYDRFNDRRLWIAPDGFVGGVISYTAENYELWYPPAGFRRGGILAEDVRVKFTEADLDYLYDQGVNPIRWQRGRGINVWGQKTLQLRPTALDRLNVRLLLCVIEPAIKVALEDFLFEFNDEPTRAIVRSLLTTYMDWIKARRGVYEYRVVCDDTNNTPADLDAHRLNVWLFVKPNLSIEDIPFTVVITRTGMSFDLAQQYIQTG